METENIRKYFAKVQQSVAAGADGNIELQDKIDDELDIIWYEMSDEERVLANQICFNDHY